MQIFRLLLFVLFVSSLISQGCDPLESDTNTGMQVNLDTDDWYRGNTHVHTIISGHADLPPEEVVEWYHTRGYNFLILSEHNHFINPDSVKMPDNRRDDFILIPGEEITGSKFIHTTAMNITRLVPWGFTHADKSEIIQNHVDSTEGAGGKAIINHPNYQSALTADDILPVKRAAMFELYNGHPQVFSYGDDQHPSIEEIWDELLTGGMQIYGVSADDAHRFYRFSRGNSNPGRGWVLVKSAELTPEAITTAMNNGDFYASNGVFMQRYGVSNGFYIVEVDTSRTLQELTDPNSGLYGNRKGNQGEGFTIQFIGSGGMVLAEVQGIEAKYELKKANSYVRCKVTYGRAVDLLVTEEFYAWGQPVFPDP